MAILTGSEILKEFVNKNINIYPFKTDNLNPNSYNVTLSDTIGRYDSHGIIDSHNPPKVAYEKISKSNGFILYPGELVLCSTEEIVSSNKYVISLWGRSSIGRLGVSVHQTGNLGDIGYKGTYTFQLTTVHPIKLYPGSKLAQLVFFDVIGETDILYNGYYNNSIKPMGAHGL